VLDEDKMVGVVTVVAFDTVSCLRKLESYVMRAGKLTNIWPVGSPVSHPLDRSSTRIDLGPASFDPLC